MKTKNELQPVYADLYLNGIISALCSKGDLKRRLLYWHDQPYRATRWLVFVPLMQSAKGDHGIMFYCFHPPIVFAFNCPLIPSLYVYMCILFCSYGVRARHNLCLDDHIGLFFVVSRRLSLFPNLE